MGVVFRQADTRAGSVFTILAVAAGLGLQTPAIAADTPQGADLGGSRHDGSAYDRYQDFKNTLKTEHGIEFSLTASLLFQGGVPRGGPGVALAVYTPTLKWTPFTHTAIGSGIVNISVQHHRFLTGATSSTLQDRLRTITTPNDWLNNGFEYDQISYTHVMPGSMRWLSLTVGQYGFGLFDDNPYATGAQTGFIGYALAQNGTQTYPTAGVGAFAQAMSPDQQFVLSGGFQSATDISATNLTTSGLATGRNAYFMAARWNAAFLDGGNFSVLWYSQPAVPLQPNPSQGVSFNVSVGFGDTAGLFLRVNNASGLVSQVRTSVAVGIVGNDPFGRNEMDQAGFSVFWNKTNRSVVQAPYRAAEWGAELHYNYTIGSTLQLTPDVQVFFNPALNPTAGPAAVFTLRTTAFF